MATEIAIRNFDLPYEWPEGVEEEAARLRAGFRVFGSKPGAYGAGLQALIDERGWQDRTDLAEAYYIKAPKIEP